MKKRNFVQGLLLVAFLFVGLQASAQKGVTFKGATQALQTLEVEMTNLKQAVANAAPSFQREEPVQAMKPVYYEGIVKKLGEGMSTANAIISNHSDFVALAPQMESVAEVLKDQAISLLEL